MTYQARFRIVAALVIVLCMSLRAAAQQVITIAQTPLPVRNGTAQLARHCDPAQKVRLAFGLYPPHMQEEEQYLRDLQDRNSPLFHQFLSQEEWNARFAPSVQDEQAVVDWLKREGLTLTSRYPNRLLVDVEAPVSLVERALHVKMNYYHIGATSFYSNDQDPSVPAYFRYVIQSVLGLNSLQRVHHASPKGQQSTNGPDYAPGPVYAFGGHRQRDGDAQGLKTAMSSRKTGPNETYGAYDPSDIYGAGAYHYAALYNQGHCCNPLHNPDHSPPASSIAIAIWNDLDFNDVIGFLNLYHLAGNITKYYIDGTPECCDGEATMDAEWTTATANSFGSYTDTSKVYMYEGVNAQVGTLADVINRASTDGYARVLNMSWGAAEHDLDSATFQTFHAIFNQMAGQGWTLVASAGDAGATTGCGDYLSVSWPAADPNITAAGGTTLVLNWDGSFGSEVTWTGGPYGCSSNDGGTGGGCSKYFSTPSYQGSTACGSKSRSVPDMALNADWYNTPQNIFYNGYLQGNGGTSIVAPELSGFFAQANAYLIYVQSIVGKTCLGSHNAACYPIGNANFPLYYLGHYPSFTQHYPFSDITSGCNDNDVTEWYGLKAYCAKKGLDQATGWGSANMLLLSWAINTYFAGDLGSPTVNFSGPLANHWYNTDQTLSWTISDTSQNAHPPNGVAGFTANWRSAKDSPDGPDFPNDNNGSVNLSSSPGQGCYNFYVRAWDNTGQTSANGYGPLCYDTIPPISTASLAGAQNGINVTLLASDNASGVASTNYQLDGGTWQPYTGTFLVTANGNHTVAFYSVDLAGNVEGDEYETFSIAPNYYLLSVSVVGDGSVTSSDGYISCPGVCSHSYSNGTQVTLVAYTFGTFVGWSGACSGTGACVITMTQAFSVGAYFVELGASALVPVPPCRIADTRNPAGEFGGPPLQGKATRSFTIPHNMDCNIPSNAAAYSLNITVVPHGPLGYLSVWPTGEDQPLVSTLNSYDGRVKANAAIVPAGYQGAISFYVTDTTDLVLDIDGYFAPVTQSTLAFYPLKPCRVADTRDPNGDLGGPFLQGGVNRDFPVLEATACNIPGSAQVYSLNFTVVPHGGLGYLTVCPTPSNPSQNCPLVSTLNANEGKVTANAAIVPAGTGGSIRTFPKNDTDLIIDINGYFAAPGPGGLSLYPVTPCRVLDTRPPSGSGPFQFELNPPVDVLNSPCGAASNSQAYVFNATVVPQGGLGYLTLWPDGQNQAVVSTLNAYDGVVSSNMAIVPAGQQGIVEAWANPLHTNDPTDLTNLIVDISSYFAP
jgi:Pro-kumamolisin, activation domain/Subtilase family